MSSSILFVRALYDFNSTDVSSLSFRRDDIIQVLTRLESGWWDGLCNGERGWFPSNYVTDLDGEEEMLDENEQASDWIPQQTPDGDVFYFNQRTGESSWALPMDDIESVRSANPRDSSSTVDGINQGNLTSSSNSISTRSTTDSPRSSVLTRSRQLPENWIQQPTEGGNTYYYYNTITKETRWTHPGGGSSTTTNSEIDDEKEEEEVDDRVVSARVEEEVAEDEAGDVEAADKESIASSSGSRLSTSTIGTIQQRQQNQQQQSTNEKLPPNWGKKMTPQGRVYYYNKLTDETTWSLENVDNDGKLIEAENNDSVPNVDGSSFGGLGDNESPHEIPLPPTPTAAIPPPQPEPSILMMQNPNEALTWGSLSNTVFLAIHNLNLAAKENSKQDYKNSTNAIVESIRIMLYASGTVEKESPAIRQNRSLKIYHRHIMASLSKLVLSTKVASGVWPPPDAAQKMKSDADEVLVAVRQFVHAAEHTVNIRRVDPKILESATGGAWRGNNLPLAIDNHSKSHGTNPQENGNDSLPSSPTNQNPPSRSLTPDLLASLDHTSRTVTKAITLLQNHIRKYLETPRAAMSNNSATFAQLISQTRQTITQVGQFLSLIEDINLEDLDEASQGTVNEFKIAKQTLYNNIAELVICTQSATDLSAPPTAIDKVQVSTNVVEKSVKDVIIATKFLVEEKEAQDQLRINMRIPRRPSNVEVPPNKRRVISTNSSIASSTTLVSLDQIQESGADDVVDVDVVEGDQSVVNGTPVVSNSLQTVPEDDVMLTDSSTIAGDQASIIDDFDAPMSPVSDGSSMTGGRSMKSAASSRFRSDSSISSSAFDAASVQSHPSHPPLLRANTQPSISSDFSYSSSPPASYAGGAKSPRAENSKVNKFFGEEIPSSVTQTCGQREEKPSFLNYDYDASEVVFNMESHVKGGTLNALVERLTMHDVLDSNFIATFLLTYRSFCTTDEFFDMLVKRFMVQPPENLTREETEVWVEKKQTPIRLRVFNIMKSWLENYYIEREDAHCLQRMREFVSTVMHEHMAFAATSLTRVIDKRQQQDKVATFKVMVLTNSVPPPPSILPKNMKKIKFLDLDPIEIARQLTIMESKLYNKIQPVECLNKAWSKEEGVGGEVAENIKAMIVNSNQITGWVAESILNQPEIKKRCSLIKHFVAVADKCRALNNFNSLTAIISGLNSAPIHRLKRTWEMVNARTIQTLENMNRIMNSTKNFSDYREILHSINPPCVPFLGVYLTDLTFIEDGNPNIIKKSRQLINFSKRMKTAEVIREIQQYQSIPYSLNPVHDIQIFIQSHLQDSKDVADLYTQSLNMEPREREDEKIARLLQESGFL